MRMETLLNLDGGLLLAIQELHQPWLDPIVSGFTKLGDMGLLWTASTASPGTAQSTTAPCPPAW